MLKKVWWKCNSCGYRFQEEVEKGTPENCPSCKEPCTFTDVTCYTPDCGGPESGNYDPRL
jgi:rubredoxin